MKHRAVIWIGGAIHCIIESKSARQFAINVRNQIIQLSNENEHKYSIEITEAYPEVDANVWKEIL